MLQYASYLDNMHLMDAGYPNNQHNKAGYFNIMFFAESDPVEGKILSTRNIYQRYVYVSHKQKATKILRQIQNFTYN